MTSSSDPSSSMFSKNSVYGFHLLPSSSSLSLSSSWPISFFVFLYFVCVYFDPPSFLPQFSPSSLSAHRLSADSIVQFFCIFKITQTNFVNLSKLNFIIHRLVADSVKMLCFKLVAIKGCCRRFWRYCKSLQVETLIYFLRLELFNFGNICKSLQLDTLLAVRVKFLIIWAILHKSPTWHIVCR